jgi:hypothetical protein
VNLNIQKRTVAGELKGDLIVEWRKPNGFLYIPSIENPLRFKRLSNGEVIKPDRMWTDGGSIMYLMYKAVQTKPAQLAWEDKKCFPVDMKVERSRPDAIFRFSV